MPEDPNRQIPDRSLFQFQTEVRVRLSETDAVGIVFHGNYYTYMDVGRVDYLRNLGLMEKGRPIRGFDNVVVHSACSFHNVARYDDPIVIHVRLAEIGQSSFRFEFLFYQKQTNKLLASGASVHAALNLESLRAIPVPNPFRDKIRAYEGPALSEPVPRDT